MVCNCAFEFHVLLAVKVCLQFYVGELSEEVHFAFSAALAIREHFSKAKVFNFSLKSLLKHFNVVSLLFVRQDLGTKRLLNRFLVTLMHVVSCRLE